MSARASPQRSAARVDGNVHVRTHFAVEPEKERDVRERIDRALTAGTLTGRDGETTTWRLVTSQPSPVAQDEAEHAERLRMSE